MTGPQDNTRFNFGQNWGEYSDRVLDDQRLAEAEWSLAELIGGEHIRDARVLDVGSGTGLFSIAASRLGAREVVGVDVDAGCVEVARTNAERFCAESAKPTFRHISILDDAVADLGTFDIVYAWGSLHHTGAMDEAIKHAAARVAPGGRFVLAIYNRHWSSPFWVPIKWLYNHLPGFAQKLMAWCFAAIIYMAKLIVTRRNPLRKRRGMSFMVDVVDWIGGYPYEYASRNEMVNLLDGHGFTLERFVPTPVPTGCNEFVFRRPAD